MSARTQLADELRKLLPKQWRLVDDESALGTLDRVAVLVRQRRIRPAMNAQGAHLLTFVVTVVDPRSDIKKAEQYLDDELDETLHALDAVPWLVWEEAQKVTVEGRLAWDIDVTVIGRKD